MKILGVIPARYASTRFPGKPLVDIGGKSMICRVAEQAKKASLLTDVIVATDDQRIFDHVSANGFNARMTRVDHVSGTDRIIEVMDMLTDFDVCVNIQGDEPFIDPEQIDLACRPLAINPSSYVSTLVKKISDPKEINNPNIIKAVVRKDGFALYFSRAAIPYVRNEKEFSASTESNGYLKHIGIYVYHRVALEKIKKMPVGFLERAESLEQLRWMENGIEIFTQQTTLETISIDKEEDLKKAMKLINKK